MPKKIEKSGSGIPQSAKDNGSNPIANSSAPPAPPVHAAQETIKYGKDSKPPYAVHVQYVDSDESASLHPLYIARILTQIMNDDIIEIKKLGRNEVLAEMHSFAAANKLVEDPTLASHKLRAYISSDHNLKTDIIKDVSADLNEETIERIGHVSRTCRDKPRSGDNKHIDDVPCPSKDLSTKCLNCGGNHLPTSMDCPCVEEDKRIQAYDGTSNVSLMKAKQNVMQGGTLPIHDSIIDCVRSLLPSRSREPRSVASSSKLAPAPWWNSECDEVAAKRKAALSVYKHAPTMDNLILYEKEMANCNKVFRRNKRRGCTLYFQS